jgi:hypothetical protein
MLLLLLKKINNVLEILRYFSKVNLPMGITQSHVRIPKRKRKKCLVYP